MSVTASPIFTNIYDADECLSLRVTHANNKIGMALQTLVSSGGHPVQNIEEAEDHLFRCATNVMIPHDDTILGFGIAINRAAGSIAMQARRGAGNRVFMHPSVFTKLTSSSLAPYAVLAPAASQLGRWTHVGTLNNIDVYTSSHMRNEAVICYVGNTYDAPAFLFRKDDQLSVKLLPSTLNAVGDFNSYIQRIPTTFHISLWLTR